MTKEGERAAAALEKVVLEFLEVVAPSERDIVIEKAFAAIRAKRARRLSTIRREEE